MAVLKKLLPILILIAACSTLPVHEGLEKVRTGMDKASVLELGGNPKHTFHVQSKDHWIYTFYQGEQEMAREIVFDAGRVISISPTHLRGHVDDPPEDADDMEQFEKKTRENQKQNQGTFEDVPEQ